ncbi:MAG: hypothetical protein K9H26_12955 [Prolixibacteraceae bacterium]|nr:hypothetical protein [Prolixibacteraceae bacterium]
MKLLLRYVSIIAAVLLISYSCELDTNGPMPNDIQEGCFPYIELNAAESSPFINLSSPGDYIMKGTVDVLFEDAPYDKITLVVAYNGNYDKPYVLQGDITEVPVNIQVTSNDLVGAIDELSSLSDITVGDQYHVYVVPTIDGKEYPPYQTLGGKSYATYSSSVMQNLTALKGVGSADVNITVPCEFIPEMAVGSFTSVSADWGAAGPITIIPDPDDPMVVWVSGLEEMEGLVEDNGPIKLVIQPNYSVTCDRQIIASSLAPWGLPYTNMAYEGSGTYDTCTGTYTMAFEITVDQGSFGWYNFVFTPNE